MGLREAAEKALADSWACTLSFKIQELESIAQWASIVGLGQVRDSIRVAISHLRRDLELRQEVENGSEAVGK